MIKVAILGGAPQDENVFFHALETIAPGNIQVAATNDPSRFQEEIESSGIACINIVALRSAGFELCRRIKSRKQTASLPVILILSSEDRDADTGPGFRAGADGVVYRPLNRNEIQIQFRNMLCLQGDANLISNRDAVPPEVTDDSFYRNLFDYMSSGVVVFKPIDDAHDFLITNFNPAAERIERVKRSDVVGKSVLEIFPGIKRFGLYEVLQRVWATGDPEHFPTKLYRDQRISGWRENHVFKLPSGEIASVYDDITVIKKAEEALAESEEKYRLLVDNANEAIIVAQDMQLKFFNQKVVSVIGYSREELESMRFDELIHPDDRETVVSHYKKRIGGKKLPSVYSFRMRKKNGRSFWAEINAVVIEWQGRPATLNFLSDVTKRTRDQKKLKENLIEKEVLLREIHHRVKNNMQIISSLLNIQSRHIRNPQAQKLFRESQTRIRSMALIHEKLYQSENLAKVDFRAYIHTMIAHLYHFFNVSPNVIHQNLHIDEIYLDISTAIPCGLIINELVTNSLKHAFLPGVEGKISIEMTSQEKKYILKISDNGKGIAEEVDIFNTETLGMQLVNMLIGQLGGTLSFDRKAGSRFKIIFPKIAKKKSGRG